MTEKKKRTQTRRQRSRITASGKEVKSGRHTEGEGQRENWKSIVCMYAEYAPPRQITTLPARILPMHKAPVGVDVAFKITIIFAAEDC